MRGWGPLLLTRRRNMVNDKTTLTKKKKKEVVMQNVGWKKKSSRRSIHSHAQVAPRAQNERCLEKDGLGQLGGDNIGVHVASGAAVLKVAVTLVEGLARDADGGTTVGNAVAPRVHVGRLVLARETEVVISTVQLNVFLGNLAHLLKSLDHLAKGTLLLLALEGAIDGSVGELEVLVT